MPITIDQAMAAETVMSLIELANYDPHMRAVWSKRDYVYAIKLRFAETPDDVFVEVTLNNSKRALISMRNDLFEDNGAAAFFQWRPSAEELNDYYISPTGLVIVWPSLQIAVYVPPLLEGKVERCPWALSLPEGKRIEEVGHRIAREDCIIRLENGSIYIPVVPSFSEEAEEKEEVTVDDPAPLPRITVRMARTEEFPNPA